MKLDRNVDGGHGNKYGLIKNRRLEELRDKNGYFPEQIASALLTLSNAGVLDWGGTTETEFFAIRLKDQNAGKALAAYAESELHEAAMGCGDAEYAKEVMALAIRSGRYHPNCKCPD